MLQPECCAEREFDFTSSLQCLSGAVRRALFLQLAYLAHLAHLAQAVPVTFLGSPHALFPALCDPAALFSSASSLAALSFSLLKSFCACSSSQIRTTLKPHSCRCYFLRKAIPELYPPAPAASIMCCVIFSPSTVFSPLKAYGSFHITLCRCGLVLPVL